MNKYSDKTKEKPRDTWPTDSEFFSQTNVEAIVRNLSKNQRTLGLSFIEESSGLSTLVNFPALALKPINYNE